MLYFDVLTWHCLSLSPLLTCLSFHAQLIAHFFTIFGILTHNLKLPRETLSPFWYFNKVISLPLSLFLSPSLAPAFYSSISLSPISHSESNSPLPLRLPSNSLLGYLPVSCASCPSHPSSSQSQVFSLHFVQQALGVIIMSSNGFQCISPILILHFDVFSCLPLIISASWYNSI